MTKRNSNIAQNIARGRGFAMLNMKGIYDGEGLPTKEWQISMYADDKRVEAADLYLTCIARKSGGGAGIMVHTYKANQAQLDSYIQCVIASEVG